MKSKNLNCSSKRTKILIRNTFAQMMAEKKELRNISVTELVNRADINRGTFYSHYDDIYAVAEEYEKELIDMFFTNNSLINIVNVEEFNDSFFEYIKKNNENYKMLCNSNDFFFTTKKLSLLAYNKILDLCLKSPKLKNRENIEVEINIFIQGLLWEYINFCRGYSNNDIDTLYNYTKTWLKDFKKKRFGG